MLRLFKQSHTTINQAVETLSSHGIDVMLLQKLAKFLQGRDDRLLYHVNPRLVADRLQLNERDTLRLLVLALKAGIVTLNWEVQCPKCASIDFSAQKLSDLSTDHTCSVCHHVHLTDADDQVRVTFSMDSRLRQLSSTADDPVFRASIDAQYGVISGHRLLTVQTFREQFPRETIPPSESLVIRRVAILFTDLAGSTALYSRKGDAWAFSLVRRHFNVLFEIVDRHSGAVVKTIGDAIMAAFTHSEDALNAAIAMHQQIQQLNQELQLPPENQLILKIGLDAGACISVTLNERQDYFGTTVNTAARVQALSQGQDIAVTEAALQDLEDSQLSHLEEYICEPHPVCLKGLSEAIVVYRIWPNGEK